MCLTPKATAEAEEDRASCLFLLDCVEMEANAATSGDAQRKEAAASHILALLESVRDLLPPAACRHVGRPRARRPGFRPPATKRARR